ncbi:MAG: DUF3105 domain-containing protein [Alphaproteobacteria bacterium]
MPKSKRRKKSNTASSQPLPLSGSGKDTGTRRINLILAAIVAAVIVAAGIWWWQSKQIESGFLALAAEGQSALQNVETMPDLGRTHLTPGQTQKYGTPFPTTGPHGTTWAGTGFYTQQQRPTQIVHALEHGNIVIYYDKPDEDVMATLKDWAGLYGGQWDGVAVIPSPGLGKAVVMTAWRKVLRLDSFEPAAAAAFVDAFRGRGPEHPVR